MLLTIGILELKEKLSLWKCQQLISAAARHIELKNKATYDIAAASLL